MKVLDRYIIRELAIPIFYCILSLVFLILIADLFDNLDQFLRYKTDRMIILRYYLSMIPYAFVQTIPWATWLGTLYLLVNLGFHNELLAMKVAGIKITSIIRPIVFLGFLIGILTFIVNDRIVPWTYRTATELREVYIEKKTEENQMSLLRNITYHSTHNQLYYLRSYSLAKKEARDIVILWLDRINHKARQKVAANRAVWSNGQWELEAVTEHEIDSQGRILGEPRTYPKKTYTDIDVTPEDLINASRQNMFLTYREMKKAVKQLQRTGIDVSSEKVDMQERLASPWNGLVMMFVTIPLLAPTRTRKSIAIYVLICVGLVFAYHVTGAIAMALGKSGKMIPFVSAWASVFIFGAGSLLYLEKANH